MSDEANDNTPRALRFFHKMDHRPSTTPPREWNGRAEQEAKERTAWQAIDPHPAMSPERRAAVDAWHSVRREGDRRENIADARQKQLSGERLPADVVHRRDQWRVVQPSPERVRRGAAIERFVAQLRGEQPPAVLAPAAPPRMTAAEFRAECAAKAEAAKPMQHFVKKPAPDDGQEPSR